MAKNKRRTHYKPAKRAPNETVASALIESEPVMAAQAMPAWHFTPSFARELGALLLLPLVAFYAMRFVPINQNGFLDPYVYTGYIHNFKDLLARYGLTYYSVRFGMIVPAQWFSGLFGPEGGYFTFRYVLALIAGIPLYYTVKHHFSQPVAILTVAGLFTSPYFARALLWDYPDAAGVPFLFAAICLFLLRERPSLWRDPLAGAFAAMAVNSNFFEVALVGIFGGLWLLFSLLYRRPLKELVKRVAGVALGGLIVCVLGCVYYWHAFGRPINIFYPTLDMVSSLARGGAERWRIAGMAWIAGQIHVLIPVFLVVCCILVAKWRRASLTSLIVVSFGLAGTAFYYVEQFLLGSDVLQLFYYFSYLMPAVFLMLAFLWQELWERTGRGAPAFIGLGLGALLAQWILAIWGGWTLPLLTVSHWLVLGGVTAVVVFLATREWKLPPARSTLPWLALIALSGSFTAGLENFSGLMRSGPAGTNVEMDVYRVALQFMRTVPKVADHPGAIRFWYNNRVGNSINSIQSTFLWGYSKINANPPEGPGLPHLGELQLQLLHDPQLRYLGLLGESREEVSQGLAALTREAVEFKTADYRVLTSGSYKMYYQLVELGHGPGPVTH